MNDKLLEINQMIYDLQQKQHDSAEARKAYEVEHGITDGEERLKAALD